MANQGDPTLATSHIAITLYQVRCGYEAEARQCLHTQKPKYQYKCFGHFDLVEFSDTQFPPYQNVNDTSHIFQSLQLFGIRWAHPIVSEICSKWFDDAPVVVMMLLRLHPTFAQNFGLCGEIEIARYIKQVSKDFSPNILSSFGHSQMIVLLKGKNVAELLKGSSQIRNQVTFKKIIPTSPVSTSVFTDSVSLPLVSYQLILDKKISSSLEGNVNPVLTISCAPGAENSIASSLNELGLEPALRSYGNEDIILLPKAEISFSDYTSKLVNFRDKWKNRLGLYSTCTEFLGSKENNVIDQAEQNKQEIVPLTSLQIALNNLNAKLTDVPLQPELIRDIVTFHNRLASYSAEPYGGSEYSDFIGIVKFITDFISTIESELQLNNSTHARLLQSILLDQIHLANEAIYQRSSATEAYLEGLHFPPFLNEMGISRLVMAATDLPFFAINSALGPERGNKEWSGFMLFSQNTPFQEGPGEILSFPSRALYDPVREWVTVTHEISHIAYDILSFGGKEKKKIDDLISRLESSAFPFPEIDDFIFETFAHWFDFSYFYEGKDIDEFLIRLWVGWLKVDNIWRRKLQYLTRSLLMKLWGEYTEFKATKGRKARFQFIEKNLDEMLAQLNTGVEGFPKFMEDVPKIIEVDAELKRRFKDYKNILIQNAFYISGLLSVFVDFEKHYRSEDLKNRLNPPYANLAKHIDMLQKGQVICEEIPNPVMLLQSLGNDGTGKPVIISPPLSMALILSLADDYRGRKLKYAVKQNG